MVAIRRPFQGVGNIIRFNRHFYLIALLIITVMTLAACLSDGFASKAFIGVAFIILFTSAVSLAVSWYVYDVSGLFRLKWMNDFITADVKNIVNINAGFDEFSALIQQKFPDTEMSVFDFYDALKRKEISIQRAQKCYPAYPSTKSISLENLPLNDESCERILLLLAAHEIRDDIERTDFFKTLRKALHSSGSIIVVEHVRDISNFLAYTVGFFHFLSSVKWLKTFSNAGFTIVSKNKLTPFLTIFILQKDGNSF
jgi:hypothetical protein